MGYFMRFIVTDEKKVSLTELESALKESNENYRIESDEGDDTYGELMSGEDIYGQIEINIPDDGLFDEEIGELIEFLEDAEGENKTIVLETLNNARSIFCIQVLNQGRSSDEDTLSKIDPIWKWFFRNRKGLMQADAEGYYDALGLILEVE
jgi:hypothetical protein